MFTVLSNTRNSNLYLIAALAVAMVALLTFAVAPVISASRPAAIPVTGNADVSSDYYQRHPELNLPAVDSVAVMGDFSLRHPGWVISLQNQAIPVTGAFDASDYFQRHSELSVTSDKVADQADYFIRHPELRTPATIDVSDYFLRH